MRVIFAGTGTSQGVPVIGCRCMVCTSRYNEDKRLRSSIYIEHQNTRIMIDAGPDFRTQCLNCQIDSLTAILITHPHKDHIGGIDDIRALNYITGKPVDIFCDASGERGIRSEIPYAFEEVRYPGVPEVNIHSIDYKQSFSIGSLHIQPIRVLHYKMPVLGFRFGNFTYITDANFIPEEEMVKLYGTKFLVLNSLRHEKHISHFNLEEAIEIGHKVGAEFTYFTHISHQMGLHHIVSENLPKGFYLAYDGLEIICD